MSTVDFPKQFDKQIRYLETSCRGYDSGDEDEAIRIAVSLRVSFHDTKNSTSLLNHLKSRYVRVATSVSRPPYPMDLFTPLTSYVARINVSGGVVNAVPLVADQPANIAKFIPNLGKRSIRRFVGAIDWFTTEPAYIANSKKITRKDIVTWAANKDGGAHVDSKLPMDYELMIRGLDASMGFNLECPSCLARGEAVEFAARNAHFAALRQMAYEVQHSPELLKLAGR